MKDDMDSLSVMLFHQRHFHAHDLYHHLEGKDQQAHGNSTPFWNYKGTQIFKEMSLRTSKKWFLVDLHFSTGYRKLRKRKKLNIRAA